MIKLILITLISFISLPTLGDCSLSQDIKVYSDFKTQDYDKKGNPISYYPLLENFSIYFPKYVTVKGKLMSTKCASPVKAELKVFMAKAQKAHSHGKDHVHHIDAPFLKNASYTTQIKLGKSGHQSIQFTKVPHDSLYDKLTKEEWYYSVKYVLNLIDKNGKVIDTKEKVLKSPFHD